jgi:hypothetical protein
MTMFKTLFWVRFAKMRAYPIRTIFLFAYQAFRPTFVFHVWVMRQLADVQHLMREWQTCAARALFAHSDPSQRTAL